MTFFSYFSIAIGGLLLFGSVGLAIYVKTQGRQVKTWAAFGWSACIGLLILTPVLISGNLVSSDHEPTIVNVIGGLLLLGSMAYLMYLSTDMAKEVSYGKLLVLGAVAGGVLMGMQF